MNNDYMDEREPLDTKNMLENGFFARLGKTALKPIPTKTEVTPEPATIPANYNTEKVLTHLYEARDGLIETYSKVGIGAYSQGFVDGINKIGSCIKSMGGEVDSFDPFAHMSGLQAPSLQKNAKRVIENTVESYTLGKIGDAKISDDGKTIIVTFKGQQANTDYKAIGTLVASKAWVGNEAIDYVYTPGEGRMSVKVFSDDGKWIDKSASYKISWELFENEANYNVMPTEGENSSIKKEGKGENIVEIKEEVENTSSNNIEDEEIGDFQIEEKK
jgi:hypothetical protein